MKYAHAALSAIVLLASPCVAMADEAEVERAPLWDKNIKLVIGGGVTSGGSKLYTVQDSNGDNIDIRAGQLIDFHVGLEYRWDEFAIQGTYGIHFDPIQDGDFKVSFERFPIELLGYYKLNDRFRVGGGIRYAKDARLTGSGSASGFGVTQIDADPGAVFEIEYRASPHLGWKARYVIETYEMLGYEKTGKHFGLFLNTYW